MSLEKRIESAPRSIVTSTFPVNPDAPGMFLVFENSLRWRVCARPGCPPSRSSLLEDENKEII